MREHRRPGDLILDHYMPDATTEAREEARENLRSLVRVLLRINRRLVAEEHGADSRKSVKDSIL